MYIFIPMPTMKASVCLAFIGMDLSVILTTEDANTSITKNLKKDLTRTVVVRVRSYNTHAAAKNKRI